MRDILLDIIHNVSVDTVSAVKVTGDDKRTYIEAMGKNSTPIIKGTLKEPSADLTGEYGFGFFPLLSGLLNHASYKSPEAKIEIKREEREGESTPVEMVFRNDKGKNPATFRFINKNHIEHQLAFKGTNWDLEFEVTPSAINEFISYAGLYSSFETKFNVRVVNDEVVLAIGADSSALHHAEMVFATGVDASKANFAGLQWDIAPFVSILKLGANHKPTIKVMAKGVIEICFSSKQIDWQYYLRVSK